ncbi:MAG: hypothetical protein PVJ51_06485 [Acidobacteriota bacterium]
MNRERLRLLLIGSTVIAAALSFIFGIPRLRSWSTPRLQRVWVVSSYLGSDIASAEPASVLAGTPVTLYAVVEATRWGRRHFYGPVDRVRLGGEDAETVEVEPWSDWWNALEILWFKVEPLFGFDNETFDPDFEPTAIEYKETFMLAWGFRDRHAADITATGDDYPRVEVGTMRFKAQAVVRDLRDRVLDEAASPGPEAVHAASIAEQPHRVTVRASDAPLGVLQSYAGLPYVPVLVALPPAEHPATRFIGGTILDFWIATQRSLGADLPFFGWQELAARGEVVVEEMYLANDGTYYYTDDPLRPVTFDEVRVGDLVSIEDHVCVLYQDRGPGGPGDGVLNGVDRILGGYFEPLRDLPMADAFVSGITIYRVDTGTDPAGAR